MKLLVDDDVHFVDRRFLGFPGWPALPFEATYKSWVVGFVVGIVTFGVEHKLGITSLPVLLVCTGLSVWLVTKLIMSQVSFDVPIRCLAVVLWHEATAPRQPKPVTVTLTIPKAARCTRI